MSMQLFCRTNLSVSRTRCRVFRRKSSSFSSFFLYLLFCSASAGFTSRGHPPSVWLMPWQLT